MLADSLTKVIVSDIFMRFCTTGKWSFRLKDSEAIRVKHGLVRPQSYSEQDLINMSG